MRELNQNGLKLKIYDSIDELPIRRFHKYNKYLLIDSGIGSDVDDVNSHILKAIGFIKKDDKKNSLLALENLSQSIHLIKEGVNPKHLAFAPLVAEINGEPQDDLSDDAMKRVLERLGDIPKKRFDNLIESLKKKIDQELSLYFKDIFEESNVKEYYDELKKRVLLQIREITEGINLSKEINEVDEALIMFFKPRTFSGSESAEIEHNKNFENLCLMLTQKLSIDVKTQTVLEFYNSFEFLKDQAKKDKADRKRIK